MQRGDLVLFDDSADALARSPRRPPTRRVLARDVWVVLVNLLVVVAAIWLAQELGMVLGWVLLALLLALALDPLVAGLTKRGLRRGLSVGLVLLGSFGIFAATVALFAPLVLEQGRGLVERIPTFIERVQAWPPVEWAERRFGIVAQLNELVRQRTTELAAPALAAAASVLQIVVGSITVFFLTVFMLLFGSDLFERGLAWADPPWRDRVRGLTLRMRSVVGRFIIGTVFVALIGGTVSGTTLAILGVPYFLALGLLMVILSVVPLVGGTVGAVIVVGVTLASSGLHQALAMLLVFVVYQQIENHLLSPLVQRQTIRMNPLLIALALLIGTTLAGLLGALLALPVAGALQVVAQDVFEHKRARLASSVGEPLQLSFPFAGDDSAIRP